MSKMKETFFTSLKIVLKIFFIKSFNEKKLSSSKSLLTLFSTLSLIKSLKGDEMIDTTKTKVQLIKKMNIIEKVKKII